MNLLIHDIYKKMVEGVFEIQSACELLKFVSGSRPGYTLLNAENNLSVTSGFIHMHMRK